MLSEVTAGTLAPSRQIPTLNDTTSDINSLKGFVDKWKTIQSRMNPIMDAVSNIAEVCSPYLVGSMAD